MWSGSHEGVEAKTVDGKQNARRPKENRGKGLGIHDGNQLRDKTVYRRSDVSLCMEE